MLLALIPVFYVLFSVWFANREKGAMDLVALVWLSENFISDASVASRASGKKMQFRLHLTVW